MSAEDHPVLTETALSEPNWEAALHAPLPVEPSLELLYEARHQVVAYLDWYSNDASWGGQGGAGLVTPAEVLRREINHAAERLIEICLAIQNAESRKSD